MRARIQATVRVCKKRSELQAHSRFAHCHFRIPSLLMRARAQATVRVWKKRSEQNPRLSLELRSLLPYPDSCLGPSPHQQGRDTKMAMLSFGGIDVSKDRLDVM